MSGDYYSGPNPLLKGTLNSVERERLRERDREARAQMTYEAEQRGSQDVVRSGPLFGEIVRVNPKSNDFERQQIERKLGKFEDVKHLLADQDVTNLFGIDGQPPPSPAPNVSVSSGISKSSSQNSHEFKKPNACSQSQHNRSSHHHHHHHSSSQRGGFIKPTDGKPAYGGRGFYPGQPLKPSSSSSNDFRNSGMIPGKGPPQLHPSTSGSLSSGTSHHSSSSSSSGRSSGTHEFSGCGGSSTSSSKMHQSQRTLNKLHCESRDLSNMLSSSSSSAGVTQPQANVENILDEMILSNGRIPVTAIAATPHKEMESKFTFNPVSGKMESLSPAKPPVDKNSKSLKDILGPPDAYVGPPNACLKSVFKPNVKPVLSPTSSSSAVLSTATSVSTRTKLTASFGSSSSSNSCSNNSNSNSSNNNSSSSNSCSSSFNGISTPATASSATTSSKTTSENVITSLVVSDLSLSEDTEDDDDEDNNEESEDEKKSSKPVSNQPSQKSESTGSTKSESVLTSKMSPEEVHDSSSSDDSESDSGTESEDSSSDSASPPSLPLPVPPDPEDNKHRWNLTNFLPPQSTHGNSTPAPQTPQACENHTKAKTDDSDSSGDTMQNTQVVSSSSSDSDADSIKSSDKRKSSRVIPNTTQSEDSSDEDNRKRRRTRRSSSSSQSSEDSDVPSKPVNNGSNSGSTTNTSANNNSNLTVVGVVRPHQRKPPSPQIFNRNNLSPQTTTDERFGFVHQQRSSLPNTAPEPQCDLPSHSDSSDTIVGTMNRSRISESFPTQRTSASVKTVKSAEKPVKSNRGRKPKSPALVAAVDAPGKRKRGRKRTTKVPDITDSEDDEPKVKVPERKRPGRPPIKRTDPDDVDWNAGPRRKALDRFTNTSVWCPPRERRRTSSMRSSVTAPDSDSDIEMSKMATVKPTARVFPAIKKKEGTRGNRDSSCESTKNDNDFTFMPGTGAKNGVTKAEESPPKLDVEGIAVQDKKKSDTLRKLFSRREEGGGKGGGKGKGGKGKGGVIVMESETERKMLERSMSPAPSLRRVHDHISDIPRVDISSPLQSAMNNRIPDIPPRINDRVPELTVVQIGSTDARSSISRRSDRVSDIVESNAPPTTPSTSIDPLPKLSYNTNGKPVLMCKIDLSKIPYILAKKRSEEIRVKSELSDTRQPMDIPSVPPTLDLVSVPLIEPISNDDSEEQNIEHKCAVKKHSRQKTKTGKRKHHVKEEPPPPVFSSAVHTPSVDPDSDSICSDSEPRKKLMCASNQRIPVRPPSDSIHNLMNSCYPMAVSSVQNSSLCAEQRSDDDSWRSNASSCSTCSESPVPRHGDKFGAHNKRSSKHHHVSRRRRIARNELGQRHSSLIDTAPPLIHVPGTNHERNNVPEPTLNGYPMTLSEMVRPIISIVPSHHGIYYSYLEHKVSEEINSGSEAVSPNIYLMEAKRLKHAADTERDQVAQGMQYLEAILSFVLTGHVLERRNQIDTAFSMYTETLKLIVYISKKSRTLCTSAAQSNIPNKIAILSLRCESILNLKLYSMREVEVKDNHNIVTEYFNKPIPVEACLMANQGIPSPHSPTPSPASSVASNSSGYSSGDRRTGSGNQCVVVPYSLHEALKKQHNFYSNLIASFNYWEEADKLIFSGGNKDFFIELDRFCGPLTLHSSLKDLVHYVRVGIQRLKHIITHHHRV